MLFRDYAARWLDAQTFDRSSRDATELRLRPHVVPVLGEWPLARVKPSTIQSWLRTIDGMASTTQSVIFSNVATIFAAAVDDEPIVKNPCVARSVRRLKIDRHKVVPWSMDQVVAMADALPDRCRIVVFLGAGLGLR